MTAPRGAEEALTVLLVEDEPDVRFVLGLLLRRAGFRTAEAGHGREAVEVLRSAVGDIDVALIDVMMPVMTGPEALPMLRELDPNLPVVFHSGYDRGEVAQHLSEAVPFTSFLPKPAERDTLVGELRRAARHR